ncbi:MAG: response regulator transcription factor [Burkholderiaceae bacterium]
MNTPLPTPLLPRVSTWFAGGTNVRSEPVQDAPHDVPQRAIGRVRVVLTDDHQLVRAGLRLLLAQMPLIEVVAEAGDGFEALRQIALHEPAIALLDVSMPGMSGLEVLREVRARHPQTKVLVLSMYDNQEYVTEAIQAGAAGYLLKDCAVDELARAMAAVARGETYLSPSVSHQLVRAITHPSGSLADSPLTPRQEEILRLVAGGGSSREIAQQLGLSVKTVETHRAQIMDRLAIHDLAGLVRYAVRTGLISSDE